MEKQRLKSDEWKPRTADRPLRFRRGDSSIDPFAILFLFKPDLSDPEVSTKEAC